MAREEVDLVVQIPLEEEYLEFVSIFPTKENKTYGLHLTYAVQAPSNLCVIVIKQEKMGHAASTAACASALERFAPRLYVCLGIAGGISKDVRLGDVCYTGNLADVLGNSKITDADGGGVDLAFSPDYYETPRRLTAAASFVRTMTELRPSYDLWQQNQWLEIESLRLGQVPGRFGPEELEVPKAIEGFLICGSVGQSAVYQETLRGVTRNLLAIETESGSVFNFCREREVNAMAIRGISDYADEGKSKLEGETKNTLRRVAARNATSFLHLQLQNETFLEALGEVGVTTPLLPLVSTQKRSSLPEIIETVANEIDQKLRELSPQYRTKPTGYRLPTPRLREVESSVVRDGRAEPQSLEVVAALGRHKHLMVYVPRTYPDPALAWVLANGLLPAEVGEKKLIPVVVNGTDLGPPRSGLERVSSISLDRGLLERGGEYVFIVDNPQVASKTKRTFLMNQIKTWDGHRFIFVTREEKSFIKDADFERSASATPFDVCDVSFSEMAAFIESAFEVPAAQAEVIALQLRDMFRRFSLPAHPSFFAGIPQEMLAALLSANKRSELIQLAVDGYLSFIVAADKQPVRLSRTNRANFLRRLVIELCVEKRSFTQAELVNYAQNMSDEFDYGINALSFVQTFEDKGILNFESGNVEITLPFIKAYLLADELAKNENLADLYFDTSADDFDLLCFDLYAEIRPSAEIIAKVSRNVAEATAAACASVKEHILLTNELAPAFLRSGSRIRALSARVREAKDILETGASERQEKIRILDMVDRVNEDVAKAKDQGKKKKPEVSKALDDLGGSWLIATVLLGSGAENIRGQERLELATSVLRGGECLLHLWTKYISDVDFGEIREGLQADEQFRKLTGIADDNEYNRLLSAIFDLVEFVLLSMPLERVTALLLDQAKHRIIGNSVAKTGVKGVIAKLMRGLWLTEIDPKLGSTDLREIIAQLPDARFLRACLTSLLIHRVKWKLSEKTTRYALLDAAEAVVKPLNPHLDKGELIRFVDKDTQNKLLGDSADD